MIVTEKLQNEIHGFISSLSWMEREANDLNQLYYDAGIDTEISGLSDSDKATSASQLSKSEVVSGITFVENFYKWFTSGSPIDSDYLSVCHNLAFGSTTTPTFTPSTALESLGDRLKAMAEACIQLDKQSQSILDIYFDNQIDTAFSSIDSHRIVYGAAMTVSEMSSGVTLIENFQKFMNSNTPTNADYASTIKQWTRFN